MKYVVYYRVSTKKQGDSGLGLEAQRVVVEKFIKPEDEIALSFTEIESGKMNKRPQLLKAIQACKELNATLLIDRVDRLTRNTAFLCTLIDSDLNIVFCNMPFADKIFIKMMGVLAEWEHGLKINNINKTMTVKKRRGDKMGNPQNFSDEARKAGREAMHGQFVDRVVPIKFALRMMIKENKTDQQIVNAISGMYDNCPESFVRRAIKYVKSLEETPTLAQ